MKAEGIVTETDYSRLMELVQSFKVEKETSIYLKTLWQRLKSYLLIPAKKIPSDIITMNSQVLLKNIGNGFETVITLVYPKNANMIERKISVISPVGIELLGSKEGDVVECRMPDKKIKYEILKLVYQPEKHGDWHL